MEVRQVLGERVRRQRMALGLNQTALAAQTAIPCSITTRKELHCMRDTARIPAVLVG